MKAKMTTNPRVSVHQCIPWVSAQVPNVSKPTSSGWRPQTKLSKYGYFSYNDLNVMGGRHKASGVWASVKALKSLSLE